MASGRPAGREAPGRVWIYRHRCSNSGYEPIGDIKALMALNLTRKGPDVVTVGPGNGSCAVNKSSFKSLGLGSWPECKKTTSTDVASYLLDKPAEPRKIAAADAGEHLYRAVCAGCHAYSARMIGPPTQIIQAMYADNPQGIADYIAKPVKKREDFPPMPGQSHLSPEHRMAAAKYMLSVKN